MNKERRESIARLTKEIESLLQDGAVASALETISNLEGKFDDLINALDEIKQEEQDAFDGLPESLQGSEKGENMSNAISELEQAISELGEAKDLVSALDLNELQGKIDMAAGNLNNAEGY